MESRDDAALMRYYIPKGVLGVVLRALSVTVARFVEIVCGAVRDEPQGPLAKAMRARIS